MDLDKSKYVEVSNEIYQNKIMKYILVRVALYKFKHKNSNYNKKYLYIFYFI